jgi:hypothetical protein
MLVSFCALLLMCVTALTNPGDFLLLASEACFGTGTAVVVALRYF